MSARPAHRIALATIAAAAVVASPLVATTSQAASLGDAGRTLYPCRGFGGFDSFNPATDAAQDLFTWSIYKRTKVGDGRHNINWKMDPYRQDSWKTFLNTLNWTGALVIKSSRGTYSTRDPEAIKAALAITQDWVKDNPYPWAQGAGAGNATHTRAGFMLCLREGLQAANQPVPAWLDKSLAQHAQWLRTYPWNVSDHNVRTDQNLAILGVGCILGRETDKTYAVDQLSRTVTRVIDSQGANNEQSMNYADWNYDLWGRVDNALTTCKISSSAQQVIHQRRQGLLGFLAYATRPNGTMFDLGDTPHPLKPASRWMSPQLRWIGSDGTVGTAPTERVKVYNAGYVFGRSSWTKPSQARAYSLRFGPLRTGHGHSDHTSITWDVAGRPILTDSGTGSYNNDAWRKYYIGPTAHNQLVPAGMINGSATKLTRKAVKPGADFFQFSDTPYYQTTRTRSVMVLSNPDIVIVADKASSYKDTSFTQYWHLPYDVTPTVSGTKVTAYKNGVTTTMLQLPAAGVKAPAFGLVRGKTSPIQGWQWVDQSNKKTAPVATSTQKGKKAAMVTAVVAGSSAVSVKPVISGTTTTYTFTVGGKRAVVKLDAYGVFTRVS